MGNQETSLSWSEWKVTKRLLYLGNLRQLPTKDQSLRLDFEWLVLCCSTILRCVIFLSLFLDLNLLFRKETHWFFVVLWIFFFLLSLILLLLLFFQDLKFEIFFERCRPLFLIIPENLFFFLQNWKFLQIDTICL